MIFEWFLNVGIVLRHMPTVDNKTKVIDISEMYLAR